MFWFWACHFLAVRLSASPCTLWTLGHRMGAGCPARALQADPGGAGRKVKPWRMCGTASGHLSCPELRRLQVQRKAAASSGSGLTAAAGVTRGGSEHRLWDSEPGLDSSLCPQPPMRPWPSLPESPSLSFLIHSMNTYLQGT